MKKVILIVFVSLVVGACTGDKKEGSQAQPEKKEVVKNPVKKKKFILELELKYSQSEIIRLAATDVYINNNRTMNINITENIEKSEEFKTISLDFPENIQPDYTASLSLGTKKVKSVEFKNVKIIFGDVEYLIPSEELNDYFTFNKFIDYNPETGILQTKKVDGKHNPIMFLRRKILDSF